MSEIYLADRECKVNASEALQEIDKQYLGWGWNTEQTTLDLVDYAKDLERQLAEARWFVDELIRKLKLNKERVLSSHELILSLRNSFDEQLKEKGE